MVAVHEKCLIFIFILGNMIQRIVVICNSSEILNQWLNFLQSYNVRCLSPVSNPSTKSTLNRISPSHGLQARTSHSPTNFLHSNVSILYTVYKVILIFMVC